MRLAGQIEGKFDSRRASRASTPPPHISSEASTEVEREGSLVNLTETAKIPTTVNRSPFSPCLEVCQIRTRESLSKRCSVAPKHVGLPNLLLNSSAFSSDGICQIRT